LKAYYRARNFSDALDDASLQSAITNFEAAIRLDPKFAHAHAGLGEACISMTLMDYAPAPLMAKARESIQAALKIDPRLPEARMADGILKFFYEWDWTGAQKSLDEAMRLDVSAVEANACYLHLLDVYGQGEPALKTVQTAVALHPGSKAIQAELGCAAYYAGPSHFAQAESYSRESLENDPDNGVIYYLLARTLVQEAKYDDARTFLKIGKSKPGGNWSALDAELAYLHARKGETNQAHELIAALKAREQTEYIDPYVYAMIYAGLRDGDKVFENLNLACDTKSGWIPSLPVEPKFNEYRNDPRYREILARLKLPAPP
jgi:tetratricopeptide (TPR) repeat protein